MTISITSQALGVRFDATSDVDNGLPLGMRVQGSGNTEWIRVQANGALSAKKWAAYDEAFQLYALTSARAASGFGIAGPQIDFADDDYGWAPVKGAFGKMFAKKSCAADVPIYTTSTAGAVDDTATGHYQIVGAHFISAATSDSGFYDCVFITEPMTVKFVDADAGGL